MSTIYLIRHGLTEWNDRGVFQSVSDIPLSDEGIRQAEEVKAICIDKLKIDVVYSSPLIRAIQTAEIITEGRNLPIIIEKNLIERDFGRYEGVKMTQEIFSEISHDYAPGFDGEQLGDAMKRFDRVLKKIAEDNPGKNILIAGHGNLIVNYIKRTAYDKLPLSPDGKLALGNCCVSEFKIEGDLVECEGVLFKGFIQEFFVRPIL